MMRRMTHETRPESFTAKTAREPGDPAAAPPVEAVAPTAHATYGGFWIRFWAYMVDAAILLAAGLPGLAATVFAPASGIGPALDRIATFFAIAYFPAFWARSGSTPGMSVFGLRVVRASDGSGIKPMRAIGRYFALVLALLPLGLGVMWAGLDSRKRGWHDMLAGTVVVRVAPRHGRAATLAAHVAAAIAALAMFLVIPVAVAAVLLGPAMEQSLRETGGELAAAGGDDNGPSSKPARGASASAPFDTTSPTDQVAEMPVEVPHDAPELEALLPTEVMGRQLTSWSVRGVNYMTVGGEMTNEELEALEAELALVGLAVDDFAMANAGRSDVEADPPYLVQVVEIRGIPASDLPLSTAIDFAPADDEFERITLAGKDVWRGTEEMWAQTDHLRGRPYVYSSGDYRFVIATDDEEWAADVLRQLP